MACLGVAVADRAALDAEAFYEDHVSSSLPLLIRDGALLAPQPMVGLLGAAGRGSLSTICVLCTLLYVLRVEYG